MSRPLRRPGYPWPGQFGLGPQTVDEIVRRLNERPLGDPPQVQPGIRWVRPVSNSEFDDIQDDELAGPSDENDLEFAQAQRLSGDEVNPYSPSIWAVWTDSDTESDDQTAYSPDYNNEPIKIHFPMFAWARNANATTQARQARLFKRILRSRTFGGAVGPNGMQDSIRFPVFFNPRSGKWECLSITDSLPSRIIGRPVNTIPPVAIDGDGDLVFGDSFAEVLLNKTLSYPTQSWPSGPEFTGVSLEHEFVPLTFPVFNWTDAPLEKNVPHSFWLDSSSGYYLVDKQLDMVEVTHTVDVEHGASANCTIVGTADVIPVHNPLQRLWSGAEASVIWNKTKQRYEIVKNWSATLIRAQIQTQANPNSTGTLNYTTVVPLDGHYAPTSHPSCYMPSGSLIAQGDGGPGFPANTVICALEWTGSVSRWTIVNVYK